MEEDTLYRRRKEVNMGVQKPWLSADDDVRPFAWDFETQVSRHVSTLPHYTYPPTVFERGAYR